jgi:hemoglobin
MTDAALAALVEDFYARVRRDPEIGPVFEAGVGNWEEHLRKLADFWSSVMLTSGRYKGNPVAAHMKHAITPAMFARWLRLWEETVRARFPAPEAEELMAKARRIGESLQLAMFFRPMLDPAKPRSP